MSSHQRLSEIRERIDAIDNELLEIFNRRATLAAEIGQIKKSSNEDPSLYRPEREAQILRRIGENNPGPLPDDEAMRLIREVMSACLSLEGPIRVAYLGPEGTYTHAAALKQFGGSAVPVPQETIAAAIRDVESGSSDYAVVPIENSLEGSINQTLDCLIESSLKICGEVALNIHHQLLSRSASLEDIVVVYGHAQALAQCRSWLDQHVAQAKRIALSSNAQAAKQVVDETNAAAIAGKNAAAIYRLPVLASNIEDHPDNTTRFAVLGHQAAAASGDDRTSLMFSMPNRPGALYEILQALAEAGISMTRIESRPLRNHNWEYLFFVDIEGHTTDPLVAQALTQLEQRTSQLKVLGSFPRAVF